MAKLSSFRTNVERVNDGEWVTVGPLGDEFEIKTRGYTAKYRDALNALRRQATREANRRLQPGQAPYTPDTLPPSVEDQCQAEALADHCLLDVRGLTMADGDDAPAVTADEFRVMLRDPEQYYSLLVLAIGAAAKVHADRQDEKNAAGNS